MLAYLRILNAGLNVPGDADTGLPMCNDDLVKELSKSYSSAPVLEAFSKVDRGRFCSSPMAPRRGCYVDMPYRDELVHISAPGIYGKLHSTYLVTRLADVLVEMSPWSDQTSLLCVGSGSGYFCSLASAMCESRSLIHAVEINQELVSFAKARSPMNITYFHGSCFDILSNDNSYDRIYLAAGCDARCYAFFGMLQLGGVLIGPFEASDGSQTLLKVTRVANDEFTFERMKTVMFAPFIDERTQNTPLLLKDPIWSPEMHHTYSKQFQICVRNTMMTMSRVTGTTDIWVENLLPMLSRSWFDKRETVDRNVTVEDFTL
jgi:protein-L-isoaspartate(D-aspartate) O-methyltransferase